MWEVLVFIQVRPDCIEEFKTATKQNVQNSNLEEGVLRFEMHQQSDDPTRFLLLELYQDEQAAISHKQTSHYLIWRDAVAEMMAEPRQGVRYELLAPQSVER